MNPLFKINEFIKHYIRSVHLQGVHSPFVFELNKDVIAVQKEFYCFKQLEQLRMELMSNNTAVPIVELGAGSQVQNSSTRTIASIAKSALQPAKEAQFLFRLIDYFKPELILELGTSLGVTTCYLAQANTHGKIVSIEGNPNLVDISKQHITQLNLTNIELITGNFDDQLKPVLHKMGRVDFVLFDGNHRKEPTLNYFEICLKYANEQSVFVFDDIYWTPDMKAAWETIKQHPKVSLTIDLYSMGIVFFKTGQAKEHFHLKL